MRHYVDCHTDYGSARTTHRILWAWLGGFDPCECVYIDVVQQYVWSGGEDNVAGSKRDIGELEQEGVDQNNATQRTRAESK